MTPRELAQRLALNAEQVCRHLLPNGRRAGHEWEAGSVGGESGKSLKVALAGEKAGIWADFATGESGDLLDLWCSTQHVGMSGALAEVKSWLGIAEPLFTPDPKRYSRPRRLANIKKPNGPVTEYFRTERAINPATLAAFNIAEAPGDKMRDCPNNPATIVFPYLRAGELINVKYMAIARPDGKKRTFTEKNAEPCLFGWQALDPITRSVALTEGEIDAMTLHQVGIPALSLPYGGGGGHKQQWLENDYPHLGRFDTIYLCLDQDAEGEAAAMALIERLGRHRCRIVSLGQHKDANAALVAGWTPEIFKSAFAQARTLDPAELKPATVFVDDVLRLIFDPESSAAGMAMPWPKVTNEFRARPSELTIWAGYSGAGKSLLLSHVMVAGMKQGYRVCIASMEMPPAVTLVRMAKQICGVSEPSREYVKAAIDWLRDKLWLFDLVGTAKADRLLSVMEYARRRYGVEHFVIDSLAKCGFAEDDYNNQKAFVERLTDFAHEHESHIHLVAHSRKGQNDFDPPGKMDVKGTGGMTDMAHNVVMVWRNKRKEAEVTMAKTDGVEIRDELSHKPDSAAIVVKQRNYSWEGQINLWLDLATGQYLGNPEHSPTQYVGYTSRGGEYVN